MYIFSNTQLHKKRSFPLRIQEITFQAQKIRKTRNTLTKFFCTSGNGNRQKLPYIISKESCPYILGNGNPQKLLHISGNGTFSYFRRNFQSPRKAKFIILLQKMLGINFLKTFSNNSSHRFYKLNQTI